MNGRNADGTFTTGNAGKPRGTRHKVTQAVLGLLEGQAEALTQRAVQLALAGDSTAMRLCLERLAPPRKDAPVTFACRLWPTQKTPHRPLQLCWRLLARVT